MAQAKASKEIQSFDDVRRRPAKAQLQSPSESSTLDADRLQRLGRTVKAALTQAHGSGQAAAITVGIDQSQFNRQCSIGTFDLRGIAAAGNRAMALLGEMLVEEFGEARKTKAQIAREMIPALVAAILEVAAEGEGQ